MTLRAKFFKPKANSPKDSGTDKHNGRDNYLKDYYNDKDGHLKDESEDCIYEKESSHDELVLRINNYFCLLAYL